MKYKFIVLILISLFLLSGSVSAMEWDNVKDFDKSIGNYGKITITNALGFGDVIATYVLQENTNVCAVNCYAEGYVTLYEKGKIFNGIKFIDLKTSESKSIQENKLYIEKLVIKEFIIDDYEKICKPSKLDNGTQICNDFIIGNHIVNVNVLEFVEYNQEEIIAGTYKWRVEGKKQIDEDIDWIASAYGNDLSEWASWRSGNVGRVPFNVTNPLSTVMNITLNVTANLSSFTNPWLAVTNEAGTESYNWVNITNVVNATADLLLDFQSLPSGTTNFYFYEMNESQTTYNIEDFYSTIWADTGYGKANAAALTTGGWSAVLGSGGMYNVTNYEDFLDNASIYIIPGGAEARYTHPVGTNLYNVSMCMWIYDNGWAPGAGKEHWVGFRDDANIDNCGFITTYGFRCFGFASGDATASPYVTRHAAGWQKICYYNDGIDTRVWYDDVFVAAGGNSVMDNVVIDRAGTIDAPFDNFYITKYYSNHQPYANAGTYEAEPSNTISITTTLNIPVDDTISSLTSQSFNISATATNANLTNTTFYIWNSSSDEFAQETNLITGTSNLTVKSISGFTTGNYTWNSFSCGNNATTTICNFASSNFSLEIDAASPTVSIVKPQNNTNFLAYGNFYNISLNWSINDSHLNTCWFTLNQQTSKNYITCSDNTTTINNTWLGEQKIYLHANDTLNNEANTTSIINIFKVAREYDPIIVETKTGIIKLNITNNYTGKIYGGDLFYNNTKYIPTRTINDNLTILTYNIQTPPVSAIKNKTFYWQVNVTDSSNSIAYFNTTHKNQTIKRAIFYNCTQPLGEEVVTLNFTFWNEQNDLSIPYGNFEGTFKLWLGEGGDFTRNIVITQNESIKICIDKNETYYTTATIEYINDTFDKRFYYFYNKTLDNTTDEIKLYLLPITLGNGISFTVKDNFGIPKESAYVKIQRFDVGTNSYKLISMLKTDEQGEDYTYLRKFDALYRFVVEEWGVVTLTTEPVKITSNTINLIIKEGVTDYLKVFKDITYAMTFNNDTKMFTTTFTDTSGSVNKYCLKVWEKGYVNSSKVCENCITTSSGTLNCYIGNVTGSYVATFVAEINPSMVIDVLEIWFSSAEDLSELLGLDGIFAAMLLVGSMGLVGIMSAGAVGGVVGTIIGIISVAVLGIIGFEGGLAYTTILSLIVVAGFLIWKMRK